MKSGARWRSEYLFTCLCSYMWGNLLKSIPSPKSDIFLKFQWKMPVSGIFLSVMPQIVIKWYWATLFLHLLSVTTNFRVLCHTLTKQFFEKKWVKNFTLGGGLLIMKQVLVRRFCQHIKHWNRLFLAKDIKEKPFLYRPSGNPVFSKLFFQKKPIIFF